MAKNTVVISVLSNTKQFAKGFKDSAGPLGKLKKLAGGAALAVGGLSTALGVKAVRSASALEQAVGGLEAVFKKNAPAMLKFADGAAESVGLAKSEYAELATVLGSQLKNMGVSVDQLGGKTNELVGLGADLAAQFGGSTSDAVSALSSLLRGERDPIERYGVAINESRLKAKMAEMGLKGLTGEAEIQAKTQATLALLYEQTADAQGAFARESNTLAGAQQRLQAGTENLYAAFGEALLPAITGVTSALGTLINKVQNSAAFEAFTGRLKSMSEAFAGFLDQLVAGDVDFGEIFTKAMQSAGAMLAKLAAWLANGGLQQILTASVSMWSGLIEALTTILPKLLTALGEFIPKLLMALVEAAPLILDAAVEALTALVDAIPVVLPTLLAEIAALMPVLVMTILTLAPEILAAGIELWSELITSLPAVLPEILIELLRISPRIIQTLISMSPALLEAAIKMFTALPKAIPKIAVELPQLLLKLGPKMSQALREVQPQLFIAGVQLMQGLARGVASFGPRIVSTLLGIGQNAIAAFRRQMGIASPSKLFRSFGAFMGSGLVQGLASTRSKVSQSVQALTDQTRSLMDRLISDRSAALKKLDTLEDRLGRARSRKDRDRIRKEISEQQRIIAQANRGLDARRGVESLIRQSGSQLTRLAIQREQIAERLDDASRKLTEAVKLRDDFRDAIREGVNRLVDLTAVNEDGQTSVASMRYRLEKQIKDTARFRDTIAKLTKLGLDKGSIADFTRQFFETGDVTAANTLLAGGSEAVKGITKLRKDLDAQAAALGKSVSSTLYQDGVNIAQGLVDGLKKRDKELAKAAERIADVLTSTIKKRLGIRSPSRVFTGFGEMVNAGLVRGLDRTVTGVRKSIAGVSNAVVNGFDAQIGTNGVRVALDTSQGAGVTNHYHIEISAVTASAEVGRAVVDAIAAYERTKSSTIPGVLGGVA